MYLGSITYILSQNANLLTRPYFTLSRFQKQVGAAIILKIRYLQNFFRPKVQQLQISSRPYRLRRKGFSFVGRQMELQMPGGQTFFPDLVFYHIPQHRYVIIELKAVKYIPEFAGKLNFYVTAADELLKGENDNPSVGLIICKSTDKTIVEWSLKDINKPLGVASYQLQEVVDRTVAELALKAKRNK